MQTLILARHAEAASNVAALVSGVPPGGGLSRSGATQALDLGEALARQRIDLGACTELLRTRETLDLALAGRDVPTLVVPELNEIRFGSFEGGPLHEYRRWAWESAPDAACPGGGESRVEAAGRFADGLEMLLARPEEVVLAVSHALPLRYMLDAAEGALPAARIEPVAHAVPHVLSRAAVEVATRTLRRFVREPRFADAPFGG